MLIYEQFSGMPFDDLESTDVTGEEQGCQEELSLNRTLT